MERPEVPLEQSQEDIAHHAHAATESWVMGVALTAAMLAALAAVTALMAEHHANHAMLLQIESANQWNRFQAKSIKANLLASKMELLEALGKAVGDADKEKQAEYKRDQEEIQREAESMQRKSEAHLGHHTVLAGSLTMFQIAITIGAIAVLTKRKPFWWGSLGFGVVGIVLFAWGILVG